jgi:hypothetical protein
MFLVNALSLASTKEHLHTTFMAIFLEVLLLAKLVKLVQTMAELFLYFKHCHVLTNMLIIKYTFISFICLTKTFS